MSGKSRRLLGACLFPALLAGAETARSPDEELREARAACDDAKLESAQARILQEARARPEDHRVQLLAGESYLQRANLLRNDRQIRQLDSGTVKSHRRRQAEWGAAGMPFAEKAVALARTPIEKAQAERVVGELYVHQIDGPVAGFLNGPKALSHVQAALTLAPEDPECNRAIGLMYLNNPPVNGGDLDKAVKTFRKCVEAVPSSDEYQLCLAMAYRKRRNRPLAEMCARKALQLNPRNSDALHLLEAVGGKKEEEKRS